METWMMVSARLCVVVAITMTMVVSARMDAVNVGNINCTSDPCYSPKAFDCPMRVLALEYANVTLGVGADLAPIHTALALDTACGMSHAHSHSLPDHTHKRRHSIVTVAEDTPSIYVATTGNDATGDGSISNPFASVHRAQTAARSALKTANGVVVLIDSGTYYLNETLTLTELDSGTTYKSQDPQTPATLSGGKLLSGLTWKPAGMSARSILSDGNCALNIQNHVACTRNPYLEMKSGSLEKCCEVCQADSKCGGFTLHDNSSCLFSHANDIVPTHKNDESIVCGIKGSAPAPGPSPPPSPNPATNVFVATLPVGFNESVPAIDELFFNSESGTVRQWPARYPNGNPALPNDGYSKDGTPVPWQTGEASSLPQNVAVYCVDGSGAGPRLVAGGSMNPLSEQFNFTVPCSTIPQQSFQELAYGPLYSPPEYIGGPLERFALNKSYWKSTVPGGLNKVERAVSWKTDPKLWRVHAYHPESWGNWGFEVGSYSDSTMTFSRGGNQEARGGGSNMGARYFSGIKEELDDENEYFYDRMNNQLYWVPPAGVTPSEVDLVVPVLETLIQLRGSSPTSSVRSISLSGFTLRHSIPTFCCNYPYESVSGGDWSIHRGGMVYLENASYSAISDCTLDSPGGNGIFLNGYTQGITIYHNEIKSSGDSSIAAVGVADLMDGRAFTYPYQNNISYNHLHDWGVWGKQTSAFFAAISREQTFDHNIVYNGPRAGINQNDGFAGGNIFSYNLIFNTVLDTGDHGNFNSWDRKPWIWLEDQTDPNSTSMIPHQHQIRHNFIIRTSFIGTSLNLYCIDHDDGSSMYNDTNNFLVYGGIKFREGLSKHASGNYMVYPNGNDPRMVPFADQVKGTNNSFTSNTVIAETGQFFGACAGYQTNGSDHCNTDFNKFYSPKEAFDNGGCGGKLDWYQWQQHGQDVHSILADSSPISYSDLLNSGRALVFPKL